MTLFAEASANLIFYHGGLFVRTPTLVYMEGEASSCYVDPDMISVGDLRGIVVELGYAEHRIRRLHLRRPNVAFEESLLPIESDSDVHYLLELLMTESSVSIYVEHEDNDNWANMCDVGDVEPRVENDAVQGEGLEEFDSDLDDPDFEFNDDVELSESDDEDMLMMKENARDEGGVQGEVGGEGGVQGEVGGEGGVQGEVGGEGGVQGDDLGDDGDDSDDISSPPLSEDDEMQGRNTEHKRQFPKFKENTRAEDVQLVTGLLFTDKRQLQKAVETYKIQNGYNLKVTKSDKRRYQVHCVGEGCKWSMWASACGDERSFQIKTVQGTHSCLRFNFERGTRNFSTEWLAEAYIETFRIQPHMKPRVFKAIVDQERNCNINIKMCQSARKKAIAQIVGDYKEQFHLLHDYCLEVSSKNPHTTAVVSTKKNGNDEDEFAGVYICLGQLKRGCLDGCRPVLSLDGCFIKGPWRGQILVAVGRDGNNQMYPVAWAVCERENSVSWAWFVSLVASDLGMQDGSGWCLISDQQKGLVDAIKAFLPQAEHRLCARHVYANLRKTYKGMQFRKLFWAIAKSTTPEEFENNMKLMRELDSGAWDFLMKKNPHQWCRCFFSCASKCDSVDNNMAEIFNASIIEVCRPLINI